VLTSVGEDRGRGGVNSHDRSSSGLNDGGEIDIEMDERRAERLRETYDSSSNNNNNNNNNNPNDSNNKRLLKRKKSDSAKKKQYKGRRETLTSSPSRLLDPVVVYQCVDRSPANVRHEYNEDEMGKTTLRVSLRQETKARYIRIEMDGKQAGWKAQVYGVGY